MKKTENILMLSKKYMIEAKFHNALGTRSDVHVSLYTKARFDDVSEKYNFDQAWLVTNTKVTKDALDYALCVDMKVISWNYPEKEVGRKFLCHLRKLRKYSHSFVVETCQVCL